MSLIRPRFASRKLLPLAVATLSATLLGGCGDDKEEPVRVERAVVVKAYGIVKTSDTTGVPVKDQPWQRPGIPNATVTPTGEQVESTTCATSSGNNTEDTVLAADIDSTCFILETGCRVSTGASRYASRLGALEAIFVNNSITKTQEMAVEGVGVDFTILNESGAEVYNFTRDNLDYQDWISEAANLRAADATDVCKGKFISAFSTGESLPASAPFIPPGETFNLTLVPASSDALRYIFYWDGKDNTGADVPQGTYTAHFDIKVTDTTTNMQWEDPEPVSFVIRD